MNLKWLSYSNNIVLRRKYHLTNQAKCPILNYESERNLIQQFEARNPLKIETRNSPGRVLFVAITVSQTLANSTTSVW